jgi:hypothetical protein
MQRPTLIPYKEAPSYNLVHKSTKLTYLLHMLHVPKWKDPILSRVSCGDILFLRIGLAPLKQRQPRKRSNHLIYTNFSILVRSHFSGGYYGKPRNRGPTHHRPPRLKEHLQLQQEFSRSSDSCSSSSSCCSSSSSTRRTRRTHVARIQRPGWASRRAELFDPLMASFDEWLNGGYSLSKMRRF